MDWLPYALCFWLGVTVGVFGWALYTFSRTQDAQAYTGSTAWETSYFDPDVEVRWCNGHVETRLRHPAL